jgi:inward rectifier potassium channel
VVVSLTGLDEGLAQVIHARHGYGADQIAWNEKHADILSTEPDGTRVIDYRRFHDTEPIGGPGAGG